MADNVPAKGKAAGALALAQGHTVAEAARLAQVSPRTLGRWQADDAFRGEVTRLRSELLDRVLGALADGAVEAVAALRSALTADSPAVRVRAATALLNAVVVLREHVDLDQRIAELEAAEDERRANR